MLLENIEKKYDGFATKISDKIDCLKCTYIFMFLYKALLDFIYCEYIGNVHTFHYLYYSIPNIVNGWIIVLIMTFFFHKYYSQNTASSLMCIILNIFYFIPITTYCGFGGGSSSFLFYAIVYWMIITLLQIRIPIIVYERKENEKDNAKIMNILFYCIIICISIFNIYIWAKYTHFRILTSVIDVYDIREEASNYSLSTIAKYAIQTSRIVIPMMILLSLKKRKYISLLWLLFMTIVSFSYDGSKTVIFFPIILIGGYVLYRKKLINCILPGVILVQVISIIEQLKGTGIIISLIFRRQAVLIAQLSENYYRFFLEHNTDIFRNSVMGKFGFDSIYSQNISKVIGNNFETQVVNCNNGLLADVWANLGVIGIVIMPIILITCFRIFDIVAYGVDVRLIVSLAAYYTVIFMNSTWSTVLLTHGFLVMCIVLAIFPREKCSKNIL